MAPGLQVGTSGRIRWPSEAAVSCRDSACFLIQTLRHLVLAAALRVSGTSFICVPDIDPVEGPREVENDLSTDLHSWAEFYPFPGPAWSGFDVTSGC